MHIHPTEQGIGRLLGRGTTGPVTMLNLLRFRSEADYSATPDLAPGEPISGQAAYDVYATHTMPFLEKVGGEVLFMGAGGENVIGPDDERWDLVLLVRYPSLEAFLSMTQDPGYLAIAGHRTAALEDSRLLPIVAAGG